MNLAGVVVRCFRAAVACAALSLVVGCAGKDAWKDVPLTEDELNARIPGNTLRGSFSAEVLVMFFDPSGTARGTLGNRPDRGNWWVRGDEYCHRWVRLFGAMERCYVVYPPVSPGGRYLFRSSSSFSGRDIRGHIVAGPP